MTTYRQIQDYLKRDRTLTVKTCWIAHAKEQLGLPVQRSHRREEGAPRVHPCPDDILPAIREAFEYFGDL